MARKKKYGRKKERARTTIQKSLIMSNNQIARLRYVQKISLNPGTGTIATYRFRANGASDPDHTSITVGHQPLGWDQWSTFYSNYQVLGSKLTAMAHIQNTNSTPVMITCLCNDDVNYSPTNIETVLEQGMAKYKYLQARTASPSYTKLNCYYSPKKIFGIDDQRDNRIFTGNTPGSVPQEQAFFHLSVVPDTTLANPEEVSITVQIDYTILFTAPKTLAQS